MARLLHRQFYDTNAPNCQRRKFVSGLQATHVGSLPRSQAVVDYLFARERGEACDAAGFDACMTAAVSEVVRRQAEAGIDIVSDGETSKISYATYVKDRYTGFAGD